MREARYWSSPANPVDGMADLGWGDCADSWATPEIAKSRISANLAASRKVMSHPPIRTPGFSHPIVVRTAAAFRWHPGDDLIWIGDVAGLAVDAVRRVQADALAVRLASSHPPFRTRSRDRNSDKGCRILSRSRVCNIGVVDDQMRGLILFMLGARVVKVSELIERKFAVTLAGPADAPRRRHPRAVRRVCMCSCPAFAGYRLRNPRPPVIICNPVWNMRHTFLLEPWCMFAHLQSSSLIQLDSTFSGTRPASRR